MDKWTNILDNVFPKLYLDKILLVVRAVTIFTWILFIWMSLEINIELQIIFVAIIFLSDALDGIYSRHFTLPKQQFYFRILDATVDKFGILFFLGTLWYFECINISTLFVIIGYNILLITFPLVYIWGKFSKRIAWIQATMWSRFYTVCVGIFCFISINCSVVVEYSFWWTIYFLTLGMISFGSHVIKVNKLKGES